MRILLRISRGLGKQNVQLKQVHKSFFKKCQSLGQRGEI